MTLRQALNHLRTGLHAPSGGRGQREAEEVIERLTGITRDRLHLSPDLDHASLSTERLDTVIRRRASGEPLAYVLGAAWFHSVDLVLTPDVLIPRPDTETLVETVLHYETSDSLAFVDMGTGSGAIAAALLANRPAWRCIAADVSQPAAAVALRNLPRAAATCVMDGLSAIAARSCDFVVSNPPYVTDAEMASLDASVRDFEPHLALCGGEDGLRHYRRLAVDAAGVLRPGRRIYCEIGWKQRQAVECIFASAGWKDIACVKDIPGNDRVVVATAP